MFQVIKYLLDGLSDLSETKIGKISFENVNGQIRSKP